MRLFRHLFHLDFGRIIGGLVGLVVLVLGGCLLWLAFGPVDPLTIYGNAVVTSPQHSRSGSLSYTVRFCKNTDLPATVAVTLRGVGGNVASVIFPGFAGASPAHCGTATVPLHTAGSIPPGDYQLFESVSYSLNPLRSVTISAHSNVFTVVSP